MFYYLGIVAKDDVKKGIWKPSFILCKSNGTSENRSGFRVYRVNSTIQCKKWITSTMNGHEDMIDFMCSYRTRDHMHGSNRYSHEDTKKYYPEGALCWFECGKNGGTVYHQHAIFIMEVPVAKNMGTDSGFQRLKDSKKETNNLKKALIYNHNEFEDPYSSVKAEIAQQGVIYINGRTDDKDTNWKHNFLNAPHGKRK